MTSLRKVRVQCSSKLINKQASLYHVHQGLQVLDYRVIVTVSELYRVGHSHDCQLVDKQPEVVQALKGIFFSVVAPQMPVAD